MTRLLCATDLLPKSEAAIDRAGALADELGANLSLLHVVAPTESERVLEESLRVAISRVKSRTRRPLWQRGPKPNILIRTGTPARVICDTVDVDSPDLLIIGPHERKNILDGISGTIAEKVLSTRKCPLLIARRDGHVSYRKVLLALDMTSESMLAVRAAAMFALQEQTHAVVIHATKPPIKGMLPSAGAAIAARAAQNRARAEIQSLIEEAGDDLSRYEILIEEGPPLPTILRAAEIHRPDVLVVATCAVGRMRRALLGSVASRLLKELVQCDVLVVPRGSISGIGADVRGRAAIDCASS